VSIVTTPSDGVIVSPKDNALSLSDRLDETAIATLGRQNFEGTSLRISTPFPSSAPALPLQCSFLRCYVPPDPSLTPPDMRWDLPDPTFPPLVLNLRTAPSRQLKSGNPPGCNPTK
jgi:hypothetical protein